MSKLKGLCQVGLLKSQNSYNYGGIADMVKALFPRKYIVLCPFANYTMFLLD